MTTFAEVRQQLAVIASNIPGGWYGDPYVGTQTGHGCIKVFRLSEDPRYVHGQTTRRCVFRCTAYVNAADPAEAEANLDELCELSGNSSFIEAVQTSSNWGTVDVDYASVINIGETFLTTFGDQPATFLACPFDVEVVW